MSARFDADTSSHAAPVISPASWIVAVKPLSSPTRSLTSNDSPAPLNVFIADHVLRDLTNVVGNVNALGAARPILHL